MAVPRARLEIAFVRRIGVVTAMKKLLLPLLIAVLASLPSNAAEAASPEKTGLPVGQKAPAFSLSDQNGKEVSLAALLKSGPVALVFYRSADW